jgi:hypothetical protein
VVVYLVAGMICRENAKEKQGEEEMIWHGSRLICQTKRKKGYELVLNVHLVCIAVYSSSLPKLQVQW